MEMKMSTKKLSKSFYNKKMFGRPECFPVLRDVSLSLYEDETLALVGESGCGKTTLGRILLGAETPTGGEVFYEDRQIDYRKKMPQELRKKIQMIFQDPYSSLDPRMTIREILLEPLKANKMIKDKEEGEERCRELLQTVGLPEEFAGRRPKELSGGQRQRIGIARALGLSPEVLIWDEPVSALDVSVQAQILNLMNEIKEKQKMANLFISHDLGVVRYVADRVAVMYLGRICEIGSAEEIYHHPRHPYTEYLLGAVPKMQLPEDKQRERKIHCDQGMMERSDTGCPFKNRCRYKKDICDREFPECTEENGHEFYCFNAIRE